jgi:Tol biopolymer transport system component/tRNA A-37 threonylcarbamoyl transferase component Bud32
MPLTPGTRLGHYSIISTIGAGGMGDVYLAEDTRLRRRVALKVLRSEVAADETAEKRLLREARAAATLEHPNICTVYEVGDADGHGFIAMQYAEGENLGGRLKRGRMDLPLAISLARQIADAVAEAHLRGIVHRDIKPQNLIVSQSNRVTVLDFGLAKSVAVDITANQDTATALSAAGFVSGTVSYMSPEQARGEAVDERSDIFSFGIVLYEMIAGTHPFAERTWADTMAAILSREPRPIEVSIPHELQRIVRKCLEKDRNRRYQTMRDVAIDLENLAQKISAPSVATRVGGQRTTWIAVIAIVALLVGGAAFVIWTRQPGALLQPQFEPITDFTDAATAPSLSPDGHMVAFIRGGSWFMTTTGQIYVKMLPNGDAVRLTDDPHPKFGPVFSPDGTRIAYTSVAFGPAGDSWDTWTVPVSGGTPTRLLANATGLTWIDSGHVLFSEIEHGTTLHMGFVTAAEDRRDERRIYFPPHERAMAHFSYLSPDRTWILGVVMGRLGTFERCVLLPFDGSSAPREVGPAGPCKSAAWAPDGRWMYFTAATGGLAHLWRQRFPNGDVEPITSGPTTEEEGVAVAADGRSLITSIGSRQSALWLYANDGQRLLSSEGYASDPKLSVDGRRLYYLLRRSASLGISELRVMELASQKSERLLPDFSVIDYAVSRDEKDVAATIAAADGSLEIWVAPLDRRTAPARVVVGGDNVAFGADHDLVFRSIEGHVNLMTRIGIDGKNRVRVSDMNAFEPVHGSPDGRWVTFGASLGGEQSGLIALPLYGGDQKIVCFGVCEPMWSPDGSSLHIAFGIELPRQVLILPLTPGQQFPEFPAGASEALPAWRTLPGAHTIERMETIPGLDATYIAQKIEERRNLFRVSLPR